VKTADLWVQLVREGLGYERFGAQGGDWGAIITATIGAKHPDAVYGVHMSMPSIPGSMGRMKPDDWGPGEEEWPGRMATRMQAAASHLAVNTNDPQTLGYALNDSPAGLAAWICERRMDFGDTNGNIESRFSKDHLITTVMLYWVTQTFGTACRYYMENRDNPFTVPETTSPIITAPSGFAIFPMELPFIPRKFAERETNLHRWTVMPRGGHYAAAEEPQLLMDDIRAFFRPLRPG
jgi:pimeloyl-ACP methyl ester carboxylesterase